MFKFVFTITVFILSLQSVSFANTCLSHYGQSSFGFDKIILDSYGVSADYFNTYMPEGLYVFIIDNRNNIYLSPRVIVSVDQKNQLVGHQSLMKKLSSEKSNSEVAAAGEFWFENGKINYINNKSGSFRFGKKSLKLIEKIFKEHFQLKDYVQEQLAKQDFSDTLALKKHPLFVSNKLFDFTHSVAIAEIIGVNNFKESLKTSDPLAVIKKLISDLSKKEMNPYLEVQSYKEEFLTTEQFNTLKKQFEMFGYVESDLEFVQNFVKKISIEDNNKMLFKIKYVDYSVNILEGQKVINKKLRFYTSSSIHLAIEQPMEEFFQDQKFINYIEKGIIGVVVEKSEVLYTDGLVKGRDYNGEAIKFENYKFNKFSLK